MKKVKLNLSSISYDTKKLCVIFTVFIFVSISILLLYLFYLNQPIEHLFNLKSEVLLQEAQLAQKQSNFNLYNENLDKVQQLNEFFLNSQNKTIEDYKLPQALTTVGYLMDNSSITEKSFAIGDKIDFQDFYKVPIELNAIGTFRNVSSFIKNMSNHRFFYKPALIKISSNDVNEKDFVNLTARYELFIVESNNSAVQTLKPIEKIDENPFYYEEGMRNE